MSVDSPLSASPVELVTNSAAPVEIHRRVVDFLRRRTSYSDVPRQVRVIETHISMLFVTDRFVYKLKKPVCYDFVDFSSLDARRRACEDEVRLNNRQAQGVYLAVLPIWTNARGQLHLDGAQPRGPIVDYVVQMRRLPIERTLDELVHRHLLTDAETQQLAETLGRFYSEAAPLTIAPDRHRQTILRHIRANRAVLLQTCDSRLTPLIERVHTAQLRMLLTQPELFDRRVLDGRMIEGHGDLRPEHICLTSPPVVFDCVEFNAEFRQLDVIDELAFLAMECDRLGASAVGAAVLAAYRRASGDPFEPELLMFYQAYRACVRAKVAALRSQQLSGEAHATTVEQVHDYLTLADRYIKPLVRPVLLLVGGLMGSGKSTLARELSEALGTAWLRSDRVRQQLFARSNESAAYNDAQYQPAARAAVYAAMLCQAETLLAAGQSVVVDATFARLDHRREFVALAGERGADIVWIECRCPREVAQQRIVERRQAADPDPSEARPELYDRQASDWQTGSLDASCLTIDTTETLVVQTAAVYRELLERQRQKR